MKVTTILVYKTGAQMSRVIFLKSMSDGSATMRVHKARVDETFSEILHDSSSAETNKGFGSLSDARKYCLGFLRRLKGASFSIVASVDSKTVVSTPTMYSNFTKIVWVDEFVYDPDDELKVDWLSDDSDPYVDIRDFAEERNYKDLRSKKSGGSMLAAMIDEDEPSSVSSLRRQPKSPPGPTDLNDFLAQLESGSLLHEEAQ